MKEKKEKKINKPTFFCLMFGHRKKSNDGYCKICGMTAVEILEYEYDHNHKMRNVNKSSKEIKNIWRRK